MTEFAIGGIIPPGGTGTWCDCPAERYNTVTPKGLTICEYVQVHQPDCPRRASETQ